MNQRMDKWTAFWLSAAVPGAGQLAVGSISCVPWFLLASIVIAGWSLVELSTIRPVQVATLAAVCFLSAEHAKRLFDPSGRKGRLPVSRLALRERRGRSLGADMELDLDCSADSLWQRVRDLDDFLSIDPFHESVTVIRPAPGMGCDLVLRHNAFGRRSLRFGRVLKWHEGSGYAFSDLSRRGYSADFPHVFFVKVDRAGPGRSRLTIRVRGKWTSRVVPVYLGRLWVWLVCREHARLLRKAL